MSQSLEHADAEHVDPFSKNVFGFWLYLMTDCMLFGCLFAAYAVLHKNNFGGPTTQELYELPFALAETLILLLSSFTSGLAMVAAHHNRRRAVIGWFIVTFLLGASFLGLELHEFTKFVKEGYSWQTSGFLTSFFSLVGTHGLHISMGLLWMGVMIGHVAKRGLTSSTMRRLTCLSLFWHFLDIVWIFIFTIVYLMGSMDYV